MADVLATPPDSWVPSTDDFGTRLLLLRHHMRWTQIEAAKACGLDDGSWSNWERGGKPRAMDQVVEAIAAATGCSRNWLMWGSTSGYKPDGPVLTAISFEPDKPVQLTFPPDRPVLIPVT